MGHPEPDPLGLVNQCLLAHADGLAAVARIDRDIGEHLRLEQAVLVVNGRADHQSAGHRIDRCRDVVDLRLETPARQREHLEIDVLADAHIGRLALAHEGGEPDRGEIADDEDGIAGAGRDELAWTDLALHDGAADRGIDGRFRRDRALLLKAVDFRFGASENAQTIARRIQRRLG